MAIEEKAVAAEVEEKSIAIEEKAVAAEVAGKSMEEKTVATPGLNTTVPKTLIENIVRTELTYLVESQDMNDLIESKVRFHILESSELKGMIQTEANRQLYETSELKEYVDNMIEEQVKLKISDNEELKKLTSLVESQDMNDLIESKVRFNILESSELKRMIKTEANLLLYQTSELKEYVDNMVEEKVNRKISDNEELKKLRREFEVLQKKEASDNQIMLERESLASETSLQDRMSKVVNDFKSCVPIFITSLGVLLTISLPCNTLGSFLQLIIRGCCILFFLGGLAAFRIWVISNDAGFLNEVFNSLKGQKSSDEMSTYTSEGGDGTRMKTVHKFYSRWWYVWPHFLKLGMLVYFSVMFAAAVGVFFYRKECVIPEALAPGTAPAPPLEEFWPLLLATT